MATTTTLTTSKGTAGTTTMKGTATTMTATTKTTTTITTTSVTMTATSTTIAAATTTSPSPLTTKSSSTARPSQKHTVIEKASGVGRWGGSCACPDGTKFQVGDNHDFCSSLACIGGAPGTCHRRTGPWSRRKVVCAGASITTSTTTLASHNHSIIENAAGVGGWGGSCTCPDGNAFQVGDDKNFCGSLACIGGTPGKCQRRTGPWSGRKVVCAGASITTSTTTLASHNHNVIENAAGVGRWGGSCTCPDGNTFQVGDDNNFCGSLACIGGTSGKCQRRAGPWSKRKVVCAGASTTTMRTLAAHSNIVIENAIGVGGWGGSCTCPDGNVFQVGDDNNFCESLACVGGAPGTCHRRNGVWSKRKVVCDQSVQADGRRLAESWEGASPGVVVV